MSSAQQPRIARGWTLTTFIHEVFRADHDRLAGLLEQLLAVLATSEEADRLWTEFASGLLWHLEVEDKQLIPELLRTRERDARVLLQEHRHLRARLTELGNCFRARTVRLDSVKDFNDEFRAHAQTENRLLYQWADARLDEQVRASAIAALAKRRSA